MSRPRVRSRPDSGTRAGGCCARAGHFARRGTTGFAPLFQALGDPTRLEIVGLLAAARGELCACDIEAHFALSQPTVSHHLKRLREAGIVRWERRGTWVYYALRVDVAARVRAFVELLA
jgi:ArsR family transcriptional regulator, arsenate/arsenite/antimonite-responsive transcriptional repressor